MKKKAKDSLTKTWNNFRKAVPIILGVVILISAFQTLVPTEFYSKLFSGSIFDVLLGSAIGSVAAGNPVTSYIIGGELLAKGITLSAVTAFVIAWVTVGVVQFPAESLMLGKRFAPTRNILAFISATLIAILTAVIL